MSSPAGRPASISRSRVADAIRACCARIRVRPIAATFADTLLNVPRLNRWTAASIHLGISAAIGACVLAVLFLVWYPPPLFRISGGSHLILLMLGVDVALGPLLTLVVFKQGKKGLKFDLSVIALAQLAALAYGLYVMALARPVYLVYAVGVFDAVAANDIAPGALAEGPPEYRSLSLTGPKMVGAKLPTDPKEREKLMFEGLAGMDAAQQPKYYVPYPDVARDAAGRAQALSKLREKHPESADAIDAAVRKIGKSESALRFLPLRARDGDCSVVVDAETGDVVTMIDVDPP